MSTPDPLHTAVKLFYRSLDAADWSVVEALLHPAAELEESGYLPFRGREAIMNFFRNVRPFDRGEHLLESMIADGDRVICWGRFTAKRRDGIEVSRLFAETLQLENRKIRRRRVYHCELKAPA